MRLIIAVQRKKNAEPLCVCVCVRQVVRLKYSSVIHYHGVVEQRVELALQGSPRALERAYTFGVYTRVHTSHATKRPPRP